MTGYRYCIWCCRNQPKVTFDKLAHTFPQSLGGKNICQNVCDECNAYFGSPQDMSPAIEVVLKEFLNLSKYRLLKNVDEVRLSRYKSEYFKVNSAFTSINLKPRYQLRYQFKKSLGRLFRRGLYMVYLEERERIMGDARNERFNFIRRFSRYNLEDYPVYFLKPKFDLVLFGSGDVLNPQLRFTPTSAKEDEKFRMYSYQIMGHYFCIPTSQFFMESHLKNYMTHLKDEDGPFGSELALIEYAENLDFLFTYLNRGAK